ncbi:MAG TPA: hypothetical protein VFV67_11630 [Actinophytocola sp.]|uniref:hypothetical protein n=1 Tax=Actinophytocola sp. TaxID=1872138 RepID=UPI002DBF0F02|nr:hypothetical protein [Actinophytocola sp.]HEU5471296.1 hypothetical protein [Actinophytocola sp.]
MRFTESDLRDLLVAREQQAGEPERVFARVRARVGHRGRRTATTIVAAAAVTVAATAVSVGYATWPREPAGRPTQALTAEPPLTARPALGYTLSDNTIGGLHVLTLEADATHQFASLSLSPGPNAADVFLWLFEPGAYQPKTGQPVEVGGRPGYYGIEPYPAGDKVGVPGEPSLTWQYTDGGWAVLQARFDEATARDRLLEIASRVTLEQPRHARLPFRFGELPAQLQPSGVVLARHDPAAGLFLGKDGKRVMHVLASDGPPLDISVSKWRPNTTIGGHPAMVWDGLITVDLGAFHLQISAPENPAGYPAGELTRIASGMTFADWADPGSWFDAADAVR